MHRPENCLPAAGYKLSADRGTVLVQADKLSIPFHALDFEYAGERLYVFYCLWENGLKVSEQPRIQDKWSRLANLESVRLGQRKSRPASSGDCHFRI